MLVVDPAGCQCIDCIIGYAIPADKLTENQKDIVAFAPKDCIDRTGYTESEWDRILIY